MRMNCVYKILTLKEWKEIERTGQVELSALDRKDGFVHLSSGEQLLETCARYFTPELQPLAIEIRIQDIEEELRWEAVSARNNQEFPHLYRELRYSDFQALQYLEFKDNAWGFGERRILK